MDEKTVDQYFVPPSKMSRWESFKLFLWNSETHQFLGRTGINWVKIILFYILFYASLTALFFALLAIFYQTLDKDTPKWHLDESLIGSNPGVSVRPLPSDDKAELPLIRYNNTPESYTYWTDELDKFLKVYRQPAPGEKRVPCNFSALPEPGRVCDVPVQSFGNCSTDNHYNYHRSAPCVFLKLNKIFNWHPVFYNDSASLPDKMPDDLKNHTSTLIETGSKEVNTVWVSCEGEKPADVENIGPIQYFPGRGFPGYFFPFQNNKGYLSPLVAVWFKAPATGVLINIECKTWAKNIKHDRLDRRGSVRIQLKIETAEESTEAPVTIPEL